MKLNKLKYRVELKYKINYKEYEYLKNRLKVAMKKDPNSNGKDYHIRSLYFDDFYNNAYIDKVNGVEKRKKYRIRVYNHNNSLINLECKLKEGNYVRKTKLPIPENLYDEIINRKLRQQFKSTEGNYVLIDEIGQFFLKKNMYKPVIIIDYDREAFVADEGNVRITFDKNLRFAINSVDIFDENIIMKRYFNEPVMILEVKYNDYLPSHIKNLLQLDAAEQMSFSKFALCRSEQMTFKY